MRLFLTKYHSGFLKSITLVLAGVMISFASLIAQTSSVTNPDSVKTSETKRLPVDFNFLFSYYHQDGNHSAVTGGLGTESLDDISTEIVVNIPVDTVSRVGVNGGFSHYSSASTDQIDSRISSASARDNRARIYLSYERDRPKKKSTIGGTVGTSIESDYLSNLLSVHFFKSDKKENRSISLNAQVLLDKWTMIFPEELRGLAHKEFSTDKRRSYSLSLNYTQVVNRRLQVSIHSDIIYQKGIISTPFHRVYYDDASVGVERLPIERFKYPIGFRLNYFYSDRSVMRFFYRFYGDTYGINAHTFNLEVPFKASPVFTLYPFYRFYTQTAADHFRPIGEHVVGAEFRTSDYDLSAFNSHKAGFGIRYAPLFGIGGKREKSVFKSIGFRSAAYIRSDGLWALMASSRVTFEF